MKHARFSNIVPVVVPVVVAVVVAVAILSGCRPDTACREDTNVRLVCEFRRAYLDEGRQIQIDVIWDSLSVMGIGAVEPLYTNTKNLVQIALPLHIADEFTCYTLTYHNLTDTLFVAHTNTPEFVSMECGCAVTHTLTQVGFTQNWIDSIALIDADVHRQAHLNLEIWKDDLFQ